MLQKNNTFSPSFWGFFVAFRPHIFWLTSKGISAIIVHTLAKQEQVMNELLTVQEVETDEDFVTTVYKCDMVATLAHDSIWDCVITDKDEVRIKTICVIGGTDGDDYSTINVCYTVNGDDCFENSWTLYTDSGFAACVSELLGYKVGYTEQGMQEDGTASMEC